MTRRIYPSQRFGVFAGVAFRPARGLGELSALVLPAGLASRVGETVSSRDRLGLVRPTQTTAGLMLARRQRL